MESVYLKTLVEVVRTGSLSRAAETLHVTQPAVSRRIKFMEDQYGRPLLDRSGPRLRPTEAGTLVYEKAQSVLEIEADLVSGLHRLDGRARIALCCTPAFGIAHLPAVLRQFMMECGNAADLKFTFKTPEQILRTIKDGQCEVAVMEMCERFDLSAYAPFALPGDEMVFASAPALAVPTPTGDLRPLFDIPIFTRHEGCCSRMSLENNLTGVGHELNEFRRVIVFDDLQVIVKAVLEGQGLAFLSRDVIQDHLAAGRLEAHYVPGFQHARERALLLGPVGTASRPLRQFVSVLFEHFDLPVPTALFGSPEATAVPAAVEAGAADASPAERRPKTRARGPAPDGKAAHPAARRRGSARAKGRHRVS